MAFETANYFVSVNVNAIEQVTYKKYFTTRASKPKIYQDVKSSAQKNQISVEDSCFSEYGSCLIFISNHFQYSHHFSWLVLRQYTYSKN